MAKCRRLIGGFRFDHRYLRCRFFFLMYLFTTTSGVGIRQSEVGCGLQLRDFRHVDTTVTGNVDIGTVVLFVVFEIIKILDAFRRTPAAIMSRICFSGGMYPDCSVFFPEVFLGLRLYAGIGILKYHCIPPYEWSIKPGSAVIGIGRTARTMLPT